MASASGSSNTIGSSSSRGAARTGATRKAVPLGVPLLTMFPDILDLLFPMKKARRFLSGLFRSQVLRRLALRELEGTAGLGLTLLLTFDNAAVAGQEAAGLQRAAQGRLEEGQGAGDAVTNGARLARQTTTGDGGDDGELVDA